MNFCPFFDFPSASKLKPMMIWFFQFWWAKPIHFSLLMYGKVTKKQLFHVVRFSERAQSNNKCYFWLSRCLFVNYFYVLCVCYFDRFFWCILFYSNSSCSLSFFVRIKTTRKSKAKHVQWSVQHLFRLTNKSGKHFNSIFGVLRRRFDVKRTWNQLYCAMGVVFDVHISLTILLLQMLININRQKLFLQHFFAPLRKKRKKYNKHVWKWKVMETITTFYIDWYCNQSTKHELSTEKFD